VAQDRCCNKLAAAHHNPWELAGDA